VPVSQFRSTLPSSLVTASTVADSFSLSDTCRVLSAGPQRGSAAAEPVDPSPGWRWYPRFSACRPRISSSDQSYWDPRRRSPVRYAAAERLVSPTLIQVRLGATGSLLKSNDDVGRSAGPIRQHIELHRGRKEAAVPSRSARTAAPPWPASPSIAVTSMASGSVIRRHSTGEPVASLLHVQLGQVLR